ncbi:MAG: trehalase [Bacteroidetes bacterium]|nr:trehalase [Bacteroidota bacterium]
MFFKHRAVSFFVFCALLIPQTLSSQLKVDVQTTLSRLLQDEDTDKDLRITVNDNHIRGTENGNKRFDLISTDQRRYEITGTYYLSNLLQELQLLRESGIETGSICIDRIYEQPADRISRNIREIFWDSLTRRIDETGLLAISADPKTTAQDGYRYLYIPPSDKLAIDYFKSISKANPQWNLQVITLPNRISSDLKTLNRRPGILSLALSEHNDGSVSGVPFVVPGGRFNEMYGWDSYFILLGLLHDGQIQRAESIIENFIYEITHYGAVLNANRSYYLTRSQPPFFTSMGLACAKYITDDLERRAWLQKILESAIKEYRNVWMNPLRCTPIGLNRYFDTGSGIPPEVEPGHYDPVLSVYAVKRGMNIKEFENEYREGRIEEPELDRFFIHDRAMRESGHDTSYRLLNRCANLATVDLNSLLYKIETDIADIIEKEFGGSLVFSDFSEEKSSSWFNKADKRKALMNKFLWDEEQGMFFDYDFIQKKKTYYISATTLYPLWAGLATKEQARLLIQKALPLLEMPGGVAGSTEESRGPITPVRPLRQWDYPFGWAPHQMLVWQGLLNYGYGEAAQRLAYRWLFTITLNAYQYNGTVPEKFDVVKRSHEVFAEYGNIGTKFSYITKEGFGWTNASYQIGLSIMNDTLRSSLNQLIPPEMIFNR